MTTALAVEGEELALLDRTRAVARDEIAPRAASDEAKGQFPRDAFDRLAELGLPGAPFAKADGGGGQPSTVYLQALEIVSQASMAVGLALSVHTLATWAVSAYAREPIREQALGELVGGTALGAYSLSEPGSGSDAAALRTTAIRDGDDYVIDGTKMWVTHAGVADWYVVMCRTSPHRTRGITALLVHARTPGLTFPRTERKMGLSASPTGQLVFEAARVPAANRLGDEGQGFRIAMEALDGGRLGIAACAVGLAQAALDDAVDHVRAGEADDLRVAEEQGIGFAIADMATSVAAARALLGDAAARRDAGEPFGRLASMAKLFASDVAMRVTSGVADVIGPAGSTSAHRVERLLREAKVLQIVEGTNQIQRLVISRDLVVG